MTQSYEPTKREVLCEMLKPVNEAFNRFPNFKQAVKGSLVIPVVSAAFTAVASTPFVIPTIARMGYESGKSEGERRIWSNDQNAFVEEKPHPVGNAVGFGLIAAAFGACEYSFLQDQINSNPQYLAIPLVTNALSGLYELGRRAYRKTRERLVKRHGDLEARASSA